ncbi:radical SAM protein [Caldimicrobium thiodismutans]|uniref:Radical SAM protein n=1 Tax=Caldimicrobium thiodismutans TaxID=1653476 RepID=A0A0U5AVR0_9BACT|nr:three-Cys-motif partner protein TcmP [Caldimicrobium thiodismutans]BAU22622.1 radical SAM protein [Caldimicrobium thiodismutans]
MADKQDLWNLSNRLSTKTKLEILEKIFDVWLTIWNNQKWVSNEWYIIDLFAGRGKYNDGTYGSPLIFLDKILKKRIDKKLRENIKIKCFFIELNKDNFACLKENIEEFLNKNPETNKVVESQVYIGDCNEKIPEIIRQINNTPKNPLFVLIDPTGLQIKRKTVDLMVKLNNPKDIMFNYILEGVRRTSGVAKKRRSGTELTEKEIKTINTLKEFIGDDINLIGNDQKMLEDFVGSVFTSKGLHVVGYDIKYPDRNDTLYYLLYACKKPNIAEIVKDVYARQKEKILGRTLFGGKDFYKEKIFEASPTVINRKTLLYQTKVEYGDWTINHIVGCKHGCKFPCYAMMMAKKFGWVKDYEDWRNPKIVANALELLEKEIPKYKNYIDFVHLCFMTDPFMYDYKTKMIIPEIKELTLNIIERLNKEGIRVTTLTKGIYPEDLLNKRKFLETNEYGITLVSLNDDFKNKFEPYSAPYEERIAALKKLADNGLKTWVSIEPYPVPALDPQSADIERILNKVSFVKKIIFGKLNYRRLAEYNNSYCAWKNNEEFYREMAQKVIEFCKKNDIKYHIKFGTPLSKNESVNIFKE